MKTTMSYSKGKIKVYLSNGKQSPRFETEEEARRWIEKQP